MQGPPFQFAKLISKEPVRQTGINDYAIGGELRSDAFIVTVQFKNNERVFEHLIEYIEITVFRHALPSVIEIAVIIIRAERQATDDRRRKFTRIVFPLLVRIASNEGFI